MAVHNSTNLYLRPKFRPPTQDGPLNYGEGYRILLDAMQRGDLIFRYYFAQHGVGSTPVLIYLQQYFDVVVNEPDAISLHLMGNNAFARHHVYDYLAKVYNQQRAQQPNGPIHMAAKIMCLPWWPDMLPTELLALDPNPMFLTRHPVLACESWLEREGTLALAEKTVRQQERAERRQRTEEAGVEFTEIPDILSDAEASIIEQAIRNRNYSTYSYRMINIMRHYLSPKLWFLSFSLLRWAYLGDLFNIFNLDDKLGKYKDIPSTYMIQAQPQLFEFRLLSAMHAALQEASGTPLSHILDFAAFQINPDKYIDILMDKVWGLPHLKKRDQPGRFANFYDDHNLPLVSQTLFGQAFKKGANIDPPRQNLLPLDHFPESFQMVMNDLLRSYYDMLKLTAIPHPTNADVTPDMARYVRLNASFLGGQAPGQKSGLATNLKIIFASLCSTDRSYFHATMNAILWKWDNAPKQKTAPTQSI